MEKTLKSQQADSFLQHRYLRHARIQARKAYRPPEERASRLEQTRLLGDLSRGAVHPNELTEEQLLFLYPPASFWKTQSARLVAWIVRLGLAAVMAIYLWVAFSDNGARTVGRWFGIID